MTQRWKTDEKLYNAPTEVNGVQVNKKLDYEEVYAKEFLDCDPLRDWESIDRCVWLWEWATEMIGGPDMNWKVLDVGTKDGQFVEYLANNSIDGIGIDFSIPYVEYAKSKGREVYHGDACHMTFKENTFDFVFSHHVHGLMPDYLKGLQEMFRVSKKYMIALNQVPGNVRKHYSYIDGPQIFHDFIKSVDCKVLHNDYLDTGWENEWVIFLEKG